MLPDDLPTGYHRLRARSGEATGEGLLVPAVGGQLNAWPVSPAVGNVRNDGPELVQPLPPEEPETLF